MTSPRSYDGVGYYPPSFSSGTPIYDKLVAERGVPQIAPINVPAALPPAPSSPYASAMESTSLLPALPPARLALGPGTGGGGYPTPQPAVGYPQQGFVPGPRVPAGPVPPGYPQPAAPQGWDQQTAQFRPAAPGAQPPMAPVRPMPPQQFFQPAPPQQPAPQQQFGQSQFGQPQFGQSQFGQPAAPQQQPYPPQQQPYPGQVY
ncbi:DUF6643 family protein [Kitasatospora viridis]|uniref:Uncharacterized protein n=1 Tax=Kitasatospora viridis TaxID=281105 RepID=A0A561UP48_9ACTN|nr:DUF6643 family protein [Kitasatospora viridis]TWG01120.1 hypothetical protein FHX73_115007 [Kitasatospora viridis]